MADNLQNTSKIDTNVISKSALVTDLNASYTNTEQYNYARNATRNSKDGDIGSIGNEPSNELCFSAPYKIIGHILLSDERIMIFSTDNVNSEIGIADPNNCTYTTFLNSSCLNFRDSNPVTGVSKNDFQKGIIVTFTDKRNPVRRIELKKISSFKTCDDILLFKKITHPCIKLTKGESGNVPNGMYSVVMAYVVDGQIFSDFYSFTNRIQLYSENGSNSINVDISNLDSDFKEYTIVVVGNYIDPVTKGATKLAKIIGNYSTNNKKVSITDFINSTYKEIGLDKLVIQKTSWEKAGIITSNGNYLILGDLVSKPEENYQLKAMSIKAEYVVKQVLADYYEKDGEDIGYYRDENYDYSIQGVYTTGELTDKFHIPGREITQSDKVPVSSADVYEYDKQFNDCNQIDKVPKWKVQNTAEDMIPYNNQFFCDERILGHGKMGYVESTELYPDNEATFGKWKNTPIKFHKMPDECKVPRFSEINGKKYINILGVRFKDIPNFDNPDIVAYKITRSDRKGGNGTVVARGLMTNVRSYFDTGTNQTVYYSNYTVNDLSPDKYLSSKQTFHKNKSEHNYNPLTDYHLDKYNFYSPHTMFEPRYSLGTELKIESEEIADITGYFEKVYNHPREKLMSNFSFWLSAAVGFMEASLTLLGRTDISSKSGLKVGLDGGPYYELNQGNIKIETVKDLVGLSLGDVVQTVIDAAKTLDVSKINTIINLVKVTIQALEALAIKVPYSIFSGIKEADTVLNIIRDFTAYTDYVYQYNAVANFNKSICVREGNKRRRLLKPATYIPSTIVSIDDKVFNNLFREKSVYLELNKPISKPTITDTSRGTISSFGTGDDPSKKVTSVGSAFYVTSKVVNPNQYGQVGSASSVAMHSCPISFTEDCPILFGGDCIITRFQFQKRMQFFTQNIANTGYRDGTEYDYKKYRNLAYPRYWMDSTAYDFSELLSSKVINFSKFSRTVASRYNLDSVGKDKSAITRVDNAYMYLSNNCALDFFVEADYNVDFREKTTLPFYSKKNTDLSQIFRSDRLDTPEEFNINRAFSDLYATEIYAPQQRYDFNPLDPIPTNQENSVIYSLPSFNLQQGDNWQYFLPANYFAFRESDFGKLTAIDKLDQDRIIFLFSKASPYVSMGRSLLELNGQTVTIGDGGMFAQDPREVMPTDNNYGACNSRYAFTNTHMGRFYPSEKQGRILSFSESIDDITRYGMSYWHKLYMPINLYNYFPTYPKVENPISGVGYLTVFNSFNETLYVTKRDFSPKSEYVTDINYSNGIFTYKGTPIVLRSKYFNDISWTISFSPAEKSFISWHDWHPDWVIQQDNHFLSVKDNSTWKHNERSDSFCNFYDTSYPFEVSVVSSNGQQIFTPRSIEYILEVYKYKNSGRDRFHSLNENFDRLVVYNTEQISPMLRLNLAKENPEENLKYPRKNTTDPISYDVLYFKEENKYRINQFWDSVNDRGEFSKSQVHLMATDESGYKHVINPLAIDINKPEEQRKKFRHYFNIFKFTKTESKENKFIFKIVNIKKLVSLK